MRKSTSAVLGCSLLLAASLFGCSDSDVDGIESPSPVEPPPPAETSLFVGAASRSLLPTVSGGRDYLMDAPGWPAAAELDPDNPGIFIPVWDQGRVDVGNGSSDASWVHDDIRATAVAMQWDARQLVIVTSNTYMHLKADVDEIVRQTREVLPAEWSDAEILIASTHNHHGPETAFGPNADWYQMAAEQITDSIVAAVESAEPATATLATGAHNYGSVDQRDPRIYDDRLNVLAFDSNESGEAIAVVVQWNAHPEVTLGWEPPAEAAGLDEACAVKGWEGSECTAEDKYFTGDFVGVLETRLKASRGGEVAYFNGALGVLTGPLHAPTWVVDEDHPVGDGLTVPAGAMPLADCDKSNPYECQSFAKTESTGTELANAVTTLLQGAADFELEDLSVRKQEFYSRVTNLGFRVLMAEGELGWQPMASYNCGEKPFTDDTCVSAGSENIDDPVLTPLLGYQISKGDVMKTRLIHVDFGDVGMLFLPGELSSELVIGLPDDFATAPPKKYNHNPDEHAVGADYTIPGYLLSLVDESVTFTIGLGTDEVGYFVPVSDYRLQCHGLSLSTLPGASCQDLADRGVIESVEYVGGVTCQKAADDAEFLASLGADGPAVQAICYYGQMVGAEIQKPAGHYEETNSAGWDLVDDLWAAAQELFGEG
jgi:hypothetical protein